MTWLQNDIYDNDIYMYNPKVLATFHNDEYCNENTAANCPRSVGEYQAGRTSAATIGKSCR